MGHLDGEIVETFLDGRERFECTRTYVTEYNARFGTNFYLKELCLRDLDVRWKSLDHGIKLIYLKDWLEYRYKS